MIKAASASTGCVSVVKFRNWAAVKQELKAYSEFPTSMTHSANVLPQGIKLQLLKQWPFWPFYIQNDGYFLFKWHFYSRMRDQAILLFAHEITAEYNICSVDFDLPDRGILCKHQNVANPIVLIFFNLKNIIPLWRTEDINSCIAGKPLQLFSITHNDARIWFQNRWIMKLGTKERGERELSERNVSEVGSEHLEGC